jgi:hypothetical protein
MEKVETFPVSYAESENENSKWWFSSGTFILFQLWGHIWSCSLTARHHETMVPGGLTWPR